MDALKAFFEQIRELIVSLHRTDPFAAGLVYGTVLGFWITRSADRIFVSEMRKANDAAEQRYQKSLEQNQGLEKRLKELHKMLGQERNKKGDKP
jgi:hypothetical protein